MFFSVFHSLRIKKASLSVYQKIVASSDYLHTLKHYFLESCQYTTILKRLLDGWYLILNIYVFNYVS